MFSSSAIQKRQQKNLAQPIENTKKKTKGTSGIGFFFPVNQIACSKIPDGFLWLLQNAVGRECHKLTSLQIDSHHIFFIKGKNHSSYFIGILEAVGDFFSCLAAGGYRLCYLPSPVIWKAIP